MMEFHAIFYLLVKQSAEYILTLKTLINHYTINDEVLDIRAIDV